MRPFTMPCVKVKLRAMIKSTSSNPATAKNTSSAKLLLFGHLMQLDDPIAKLKFSQHRYPPHSIPALL